MAAGTRRLQTLARRPGLRQRRGRPPRGLPRLLAVGGAAGRPTTTCAAAEAERADPAAAIRGRRGRPHAARSAWLEGDPAAAPSAGAGPHAVRGFWTAAAPRDHPGHPAAASAARAPAVHGGDAPHCGWAEGAGAGAAWPPTAAFVLQASAAPPESGAGGATRPPAASPAMWACCPGSAAPRAASDCRRARLIVSDRTTLTRRISKMPSR